MPLLENEKDDKNRAEWLKLKDEIVHCQKCSLHQSRTYPVIGEGSHQAKVMFVGEAPGFNEDQTGHPFCGAAGQVLNDLLEKINLLRTEVYICNVLKCRPPQNRDPQKEEIEACSPYLDRQIFLIQPKIICPLGNYSSAYILEKYGLKSVVQGISKIHGQVFEVKTLFSTLKIIPLYHPAVATYNPKTKTILENDFKVLQKTLG